MLAQHGAQCLAQPEALQNEPFAPAGPRCWEYLLQHSPPGTTPELRQQPYTHLTIHVLLASTFTNTHLNFYKLKELQGVYSSFNMQWQLTPWINMKSLC